MMWYCSCICLWIKSRTQLKTLKRASHWVQRLLSRTYRNATLVRLCFFPSCHVSVLWNWEGFEFDMPPMLLFSCKTLLPSLTRIVVHCLSNMTLLLCRMLHVVVTFQQCTCFLLICWIWLTSVYQLINVLVVYCLFNTCCRVNLGCFFGFDFLFFCFRSLSSQKNVRTIPFSLGHHFSKSFSDDLSATTITWSLSVLVTF